MILIPNFWDLSPDEKTKQLKNVYDFGPVGKYAAGELPHIKDMVDVPAGPAEHHPELNQAIHNWMVYEQSRKLSDDPRDWFAASLHDLGKVHTNKDIWPKQHGHEGAGVKPVEELSDHLNVPEDWKDVAKIVAKHHLKGHTAKELNPKTLRKFFNLFKNEKDFQTFLNATEADHKGRGGKENDPHPHLDYLSSKRQEHLSIPEPMQPSKTQLTLSTPDLMKELNISGPKVGEIVKKLKKLVDSNPEINEPNILLDAAKRLM